MMTKKNIHDAIDKLYDIPDAAIIIRRYMEGLVEAFKDELAFKSKIENDFQEPEMTLFENTDYDGMIRKSYDLQPSDTVIKQLMQVWNDSLESSQTEKEEPCLITINKKELPVPAELFEMLNDVIDSPDLKEIVLSHYNLIVKPFSNTTQCDNK